MAIGEFLGWLFGGAKDENERILAEIKALPQDTKTLDLSYTKLTSLSGVELPLNLERFLLIGTNLTSLSGVELPTNLRELNLRGTKLTSLDDVKLPVNLERLFLSNLRLTSLSGVELPLNLERLDLHDANLTSLSGVKLPANLRSLDLSSTDLTSLEGVVLPANLQYLYLCNTRMTRVPENIEKLRNLRMLNLSGMELEELPDWLPELGLPITRESRGNGIRLAATTVKDVDMSIFDRPPGGDPPMVQRTEKPGRIASE